MTGTNVQPAGTAEDTDERTQGTSQYLTFLLAGAEYGLDILKVQEVRGWEPATLVPNTGEWICGVINLRGAIVPVVDLRRTFGLRSSPFGPTTVVIVVKAATDGSTRTVGVVVDAVCEVHNVADRTLRPAPGCDDTAGAAHFKGLATVDGKMVVLLDIDRLIATALLPEAVRPVDGGHDRDDTSDPGRVTATGARPALAGDAELTGAGDRPDTGAYR